MIFKNCRYIIAAGLVLLELLFTTCSREKKSDSTFFEVLDHKQTGIDFTNKLKPGSQFNMFNYMYFYNGAGVGAGDFNNDGLIDLFFSSNQGDNKIYINKGGLKFTDVSKEASLPQDSGWSTGVSIVDINNDGLLDIYVCKVGRYEILNSKNQLLICKGIDKNGIPFYEDMAGQYGLDFSGFSTQALFFDYDMDGDLDMYLLNHAVHQNGSFAPRSNFIATYNPLSGDRIFRNEVISSTSAIGEAKVMFTDITKEAGINSSSIGYGLGIVASDINMDGYPDLYIGNDFHENDYLYINQKNGRFKDESEQHLMHSSKFSMGVDVADVNNDGAPEIISMDMLPYDPYILKRSLGEDEYDIFLDKISIGYNYQYSRNNLQYNRKNGMFSELGLFSGVYATDWSWAPLFVDFDNDGLKDLFISNGIPKRLNDMDYINFVSSDEIQQKVNANKMDENNMALINKFPEIKIPNKFFKNNGEFSFTDMADSIGSDKTTYSNGAVYADLDNDGDLDIVVNNIDDPVLIYENKANDKKDKRFLEIKLQGSEYNNNAIGAKVIVFSNQEIRTYENYPVRGFQSSMQVPLHIGLDKSKIDSVFLIWPDNTYQPLSIGDSSHLTIKYFKDLPSFDYKKVNSFFRSAIRPMNDITDLVNISYQHLENQFNEFNREPLMPHMVSTEGPALAVGDINKDGLEDVFIGAAKTKHNAIFIQVPGGRFRQLQQPAMLKDSMYEDVDACWIDVNNDGFTDLVVASGGNEYYGKDIHLSPRVYLNDGQTQFNILKNAFNNIFLTASCIVPYDFNNDGYMDLFIGGRAVPWDYGQIPSSYLLQNDGTGRFIDVTAKSAKELSKVGMVTRAVWCDIDNDHDSDLVISCEWGRIEAFINDKGTFTKRSLTEKNGWWNFILPVDIDNDGDMDFIAGNLGLNSRLKASVEEPVRLYFNDFDDNGKGEQVLTYYISGKEFPFGNKDDLQKQLPYIKKKFLYAGDFAKASIKDIFGSAKLKEAQLLTADYFANAVLINNGNLNFTTVDLPWQAQLTPYRDAVIIDANNDQLPDILLGGNYYGGNIQQGRYDADFGCILVNKGNGNFACETINGVVVKGQVRRIKPIEINGRKSFVLVRNNDSTRVIQFSSIGK
ncbi:MAG: VCBS repeat-containing protein [Chitinophagaceae bacterium]